MTTALGYSSLKTNEQYSCTNMYTPFISSFLPRLAYARDVLQSFLKTVCLLGAKE